MSLEMAHKVILPPQKNYIPQFLKQRDINSYNTVVVLWRGEEKYLRQSDCVLRNEAFHIFALCV